MYLKYTRCLESLMTDLYVFFFTSHSILEYCLLPIRFSSVYILYEKMSPFVSSVWTNPLVWFGSSVGSSKEITIEKQQQLKSG